MIVCAACGTENPEGSTYCQKCATRLDTDTQQRLAERRAAHMVSGVRWSMVVGAAAIAVVIILIVLFVLGVL